MSDMELHSTLINIQAVEINGCWRLLHSSIMDEVLTLIYTICFIQDLDILNTEISYSAIKKAIVEEDADIFQSYPEVIVQHCLFITSKNPQQSRHLSPETRIQIDANKMYRIKAKILFEKRSEYDLEKFMGIWKEGLPDTFPDPEIACLKGLALIQKEGRKEKVIYLPEIDLPFNISARLQELFSVQLEWTLKDITPYISRFCANEKMIKALLMKYTNSVKRNSDFIYTKRPGK
ncbi:Sister chromatid cohesion protein Dcc1 domain-containing protein [Rozella allomycis CSF55]|uniref:Sister chromatid cohesion protein Dcc1 domain-containing protein n=1 Tax=Rozella allomycis (strain CSF55) TaxID=988480 RepID=A0A075B2A0_ROZAC|nr:Sister chromatid cohesion protein Dcc1 domain-containing protein [Rozella allomycis CSF55]|eukprot:EPZ36501.1 Sister chromatid cohesion protein Dcc1 domain-containing protein [Rozella allomycis CSF55]